MSKITKGVSQAASDLIALRNDAPNSSELRRIAASIIGASVRSELAGL